MSHWNVFLWNDMGSCLFKSVYARWAVQYQIGNETWSYYASLLWYHMLSNAKKCVYIIYCYNRIKFLLMTSSVDCNQSCSICVVVLHDVNNSYASVNDRCHHIWLIMHKAKKSQTKLPSTMQIVQIALCHFL